MATFYVANMDSDVVFSPFQVLLVTFGISPRPPTSDRRGPKMNSWNPLEVMEVCFKFPGFSRDSTGVFFFCWSSSCSFFFQGVFWANVLPKINPNLGVFFFWKGIRTPNRKPFQMDYQLEFAEIFHDSFWGILPKSLQNHLKILQNHPRSPQNHIQIFATGRSLIWNWCHNHRSHVHPITHGHTGLWSSRRSRPMAFCGFFLEQQKSHHVFKVWKGAQNIWMFPKIGVPPKHPKMIILVGKPMVFGYHHLGNPHMRNS